MKAFKPNPEIEIQKHATTDPILLWTLWRSGTHWLAQMLSDLTGVAAIYNSEDGRDYRQETLTQIANLQQGDILIRHICLRPAELMPLAEQHSFRVVFLYRDPRDVIVSNIHMRKYREGYRAGLPPFPDMSIADIMAWELNELGDIYTNLLPEWAETNDSRLLKARYEDLHADPANTLRRIATFCDIPSSDEVLQRIITVNAFEKKAGRKPGAADSTAHARKGVIGDFRNFFTQSDQARINTILGTALDRLGYPR